MSLAATAASRTRWRSRGAGAGTSRPSAPARLAADLREVTLEPIEGEACALEPLARAASAACRTCCRYERRLRSLLAAPVGRRALWEEPYVAACAQVAAAAPRTRARRAGHVSEPRQALSVSVQPFRVARDGSRRRLDRFRPDRSRRAPGPEDRCTRQGRRASFRRAWTWSGSRSTRRLARRAAHRLGWDESIPVVVGSSAASCRRRGSRR